MYTLQKPQRDHFEIVEPLPFGDPIPLERDLAQDPFCVSEFMLLFELAALYGCIASTLDFDGSDERDLEISVNHQVMGNRIRFFTYANGKIDHVDFLPWRFSFDPHDAQEFPPSIARKFYYAMQDAALAALESAVVLQTLPA